MTDDSDAAKGWNQTISPKQDKAWTGSGWPEQNQAVKPHTHN